MQTCCCRLEYWLAGRPISPVASVVSGTHQNVKGGTDELQSGDCSSSPRLAETLFPMVPPAIHSCCNRCQVQLIPRRRPRRQCAEAGLLIVMSMREASMIYTCLSLFLSLQIRRGGTPTIKRESPSSSFALELCSPQKPVDTVSRSRFSVFCHHGMIVATRLRMHQYTDSPATDSHYCWNGRHHLEIENNSLEHITQGKLHPVTISNCGKGPL